MLSSHLAESVSLLKHALLFGYRITLASSSSHHLASSPMLASLLLDHSHDPFLGSVLGPLELSWDPRTSDVWSPGLRERMVSCGLQPSSVESSVTAACLPQSRSLGSRVPAPGDESHCPRPPGKCRIPGRFVPLRDDDHLAKHRGDSRMPDGQ